MELIIKNNSFQIIDNHYKVEKPILKKKGFNKLYFLNKTLF
jgi:hypothetical protein